MNKSEAIEQELKKELSAVDSEVLSLKVIDLQTYLKAGGMFNAIRAAEKRVRTKLDPLCKSADETHKGLTKWRAEELAKYAPLKAHINTEQTTWNLEQEKIRQAEEDRLRREAEAKEEEERLQAAIEAEKTGNQGEAEEILNEPVYVAPPVVEKTVPKVAGQAMTTTWKWRLKDINKVPRQYLQLNEVAVNAAVWSLKDQSNIPGIEPYPVSSMKGVRQ